MSGWMSQADPQAAYAAQRGRSRSPLLRFAVIFIVVLVVVLVVVAALAPAAPAPSCPTAPAPCTVPPKPPSGGGGTTGGGGGQTGSATAELVVGTAWSSTKFGFSLHYDAEAWDVQDDEPDLLQLKSPADPDADREDWVIVEGATASSETPDQMIDARVASLSQSVPDLAEDTDGTYYEVKGAEIGGVPGIARVYVGTLDDTDGTPIAPVRYTIVAATNGQLTIGLTVRTLDPDAIADHGPPALTWHMLSRQLADALLEDVRWPAAQ
jgi:hypothetical protein